MAAGSPCETKILVNCWLLKDSCDMKKDREVVKRVKQNREWDGEASRKLWIQK